MVSIHSLKQLKVWEVNDYLEAKLIADKEAELDTGEEAVLAEQQKADLTDCQ